MVPGGWNAGRVGMHARDKYCVNSLECVCAVHVCNLNLVD